MTEPQAPNELNVWPPPGRGLLPHPQIISADPQWTGPELKDLTGTAILMLEPQAEGWGRAMWSLCCLGIFFQFFMAQHLIKVLHLVC